MGQSLVEFCAVLPLAILLFAAVIDGGYMMLVAINIHTGVREGAQLALYDKAFSNDTIKKRIKDSVYAAPIADSEITIAQTANITIGSTVHQAYEIKVNHKHYFLLPFVFAAQSTIDLQSTITSMVVTGLTP
ncbi:MAG: pilus assembly protein [Candidatus Riflebacteria bacterium]|nr:pilus assembly protein [Candidatus Riflebacteria bacterium]